jgi:hypothetical protein
MYEKIGETRLDNGDLFIFFGKQANGYGGLRFYVSVTWATKIASYKSMNNRIAVIRFHLEEPTDSSMIRKRGSGNHKCLQPNTNQHKTNPKPELAKQFYNNLRTKYSDE